MSVPKLRFPEFTDDWEQRKFGDVFEEYSEKNHEDLPPLTIVQGSGTIPREESGRDIKYDKSSLNNYKLVNPGDFILHLRSFEGGLEVANSQGIVSPAYHIFRGIRTDSRFYYPFFRSHDFINILLKPHVYGIRDGKSIDVEGMKSIKIPYPDFDEQKRIGDFFDHLDNAITLHQRKLEGLRILKKSMLQKMFPSEGYNVPEVRFPGFTAAWEQRKLGDLVVRYKELVPTPHNGYWKLSIRSHAKGTFLTYVEPGKELEERQLSKVKADQLMFNIVFAWEHAVAITSQEDTKALVSHRFPQFSFNKDLTPEFFRYVMLDERFRQHLWLASPSGAGRNKTLNIADALGYMFYIPSVSEQKKISEFLNTLDNTITLHQRKCDDLQKLKKALLQQMFC